MHENATESGMESPRNVCGRFYEAICGKLADGQCVLGMNKRIRRPTWVRLGSEDGLYESVEQAESVGPKWVRPLWEGWRMIAPGLPIAGEASTLHVVSTSTLSPSEKGSGQCICFTGLEVFGMNHVVPVNGPEKGGQLDVEFIVENVCFRRFVRRTGGAFGTVGSEAMLCPFESMFVHSLERAIVTGEGRTLIGLGRVGREVWFGRRSLGDRCSGEWPREASARRRYLRGWSGREVHQGDRRWTP